MISVLDENDNPPKFQKNSYEAEIAENSPADTTVVPVSYAFHLRAIKVPLSFPLSISLSFSISPCLLCKTSAHKTVCNRKRQRFRPLVSNLIWSAFGCTFSHLRSLNCSQPTIHFFYISPTGLQNWNLLVKLKQWGTVLGLFCNLFYYGKSFWKLSEKVKPRLGKHRAVFNWLLKNQYQNNCSD